MKPVFRFATKKALDELAEELNLSERIPEWDSVAGYSYTPANSEDFNQYLSHYFNTDDDDDKKFVLMEMILQANVDQTNESKFMICWEKVKPILIQDFSIHKYTIHYWKNMTEANFENCRLLNPLLEKLVKMKEI